MISQCGIHTQLCNLINISRYFNLIPKQLCETSRRSREVQAGEVGRGKQVKQFVISCHPEISLAPANIFIGLPQQVILKYPGHRMINLIAGTRASWKRKLRRRPSHWKETPRLMPSRSRPRLRFVEILWILWTRCARCEYWNVGIKSVGDNLVWGWDQGQRWGRIFEGNLDHGGCDGANGW